MSGHRIDVVPEEVLSRKKAALAALEHGLTGDISKEDLRKARRVFIEQNCRGAEH
ncbi:MAG: hypothetical protein Q7T51_03025 [Candidatus Moranbacteria bacterium]|nr:hypothetical protein [Candidatus Moranbacteria bacterium]